MISEDTVVFPNNAVNLVALRTGLLDEQIRVFRRPLRESDPQVSAGIIAATWEPDSESMQIMGQPMGRNEPTLQTYLIAVQAFVKDFNEERGLARHSVLSKMIRSMLYRDEPLRVGLSSLSVTMNDSVERARRWGIRSQRFFSNEIDGDFLYLSTLEFWLETETV
jgi:hypothetical protein